MTTTTDRAEARWAQEVVVLEVRRILGATFADFVANPSAEAWRNLEKAMSEYQTQVKS